MAGETNWKLKYNELKMKYMNDVDTAFRLGFEEGSKQSQLDQANQQLQQAQAQAQAMAGGPPGQPGEGPDVNNNGAPGTPDQGAAPDKSGAPSIQPNPVSANPEGSELDQHIAKLESMVSKSEVPMEDLKKSIQDLKSARELRKSHDAISGIAKALHKPQFKFGVQAAHNLNSTAKASVTMHHKIVNDIMAKWEQEEEKASKDILAQLNIEGLTKKD